MVLFNCYYMIWNNLHEVNIQRLVNIQIVYNTWSIYTDYLPYITCINSKFVHISVTYYCLSFLMQYYTTMFMYYYKSDLLYEHYYV
jgi:hypothetical protein